MRKQGFTLIELLAVIVILAIIALIAVPIVINIINDSKYESQKRSIDHYAKAVEQAATDYQLKNNKKVEGRFNTTDGKNLTKDDIILNVDYKGNVVCNRLIVNKDGSIYLSECTVDGDKVYISQEESKKENPKYYEYGKTEYGMIIENKNHSSKFLSTGVYGSRISQFTIHNDINIPEGYESTDCSYNKDRSVICYWKDLSDLNKPDEYEMHLASDGDMYTPYDSSYLFYYLGAGYYNWLRTLHLTGLDTSKTTNMSYMFSSVGSRLKEFVFGDKFDTSKVTNMEGMFKHIGEDYSEKLVLPDKFDTSKVTNMSYMFYSAFGHAKIELGDKFDTSNVTNMSHMFQEAGRYGTINLDLGDKFDTSNVTDMSDMFHSMERLRSLNLGDKFDTSNVTNMQGMFSHLTYIEELNLGDKFDTSKVTNMIEMFGSTGYKYMTSLELGDKFDTTNVIDMSYMFYATGYESMINLNLGNSFDTSNVTRMYQMFDNAGKNSMETLNLGKKFVISNNCQTYRVFADCGTNGKLTKVIVPSDTLKTKILGLGNDNVPAWWNTNNIIQVQSN